LERRRDTGLTGVLGGTLQSLVSPCAASTAFLLGYHVTLGSMREPAAGGTQRDDVRVCEEQGGRNTPNRDLAAGKSHRRG